MPVPVPTNIAIGIAPIKISVSMELNSGLIFTKIFIAESIASMVYGIRLIIDITTERSQRANEALTPISGGASFIDTTKADTKKPKLTRLISMAIIAGAFEDTLLINFTAFLGFIVA
jgi:hypothetical protein